jgi:hypothetical protein
MEAVKIGINQMVEINKSNPRDSKFWKELQGKRARVVSVHTRAAVVELEENKQLFVIKIANLKVVNG